MANNPRHYGGSTDVAGGSKAMRLLQLGAQLVAVACQSRWRGSPSPSVGCSVSRGDAITAPRACSAATPGRRQAGARRTSPAARPRPTGAKSTTRPTASAARGDRGLAERHRFAVSYRRGDRSGHHRSRDPQRTVIGRDGRNRQDTRPFFTTGAMTTASSVRIRRGRATVLRTQTGEPPHSLSPLGAGYSSASSASSSRSRRRLRSSRAARRSRSVKDSA